MIKSAVTAVVGLMFVIGFAFVGFAPVTSNVSASKALTSIIKLKPSAEMLKTY